jgi:uncharacterized OB-fold protein
VIDPLARPLPEPSPLSAPFWAACGEHRLTVQYCEACQTRIFTPEPVCPACLNRELSWVDSPGTGTVYSFSVVHRSLHPALPAPYVVAVIDLDDGWSMVSNVVGMEPSALRGGERVGVTFDDVTAGVTLPLFAPLLAEPSIDHANLR